MIGIFIGVWQVLLGGGSGAAVYSPSLDFSDARNSQYVGQVV